LLNTEQESHVERRTICEWRGQSDGPG
jgi:hypothetical protein